MRDSLNLLIISVYCGETGIRTPDTLLTYTRFPGVPLQPLEHLSLAFCGCKGSVFTAKYADYPMIFNIFLQL